MTRWNHTIDNPSPLLSYKPASQWRVPTNVTDPAVGSYQNGTAIVATAPGAKLTFEFLGTGIWVYGAKRTNYGYYNVAINGTSATYNANSASDTFRQTIFSKSDLPLSQYTIEITCAPIIDPNVPNVGFDVDYVTWETEYDGPGGPVNAQVTELTFDDSHPRFQFLGSWTDVTGSNSTADGTSEVTSSSSASVQFTFDGDAIALYGAVDPSHGNFTASVDGRQSRTMSGFWNSTAFQQMLYYAENLGAGTHNLIVNNVPVDDREVLSVDFVKTWTARGGSSETPTPPASKPYETGPIAGGVVGGVVFLVALALAIWFFMRRRRKQASSAPLRAYGNSPFAASTASSSANPFGERYAVGGLSRANSTKSAGYESQNSHQSHPSMASVSSSVTDSSTRQLVEASMKPYSDDVIPLSRIRPTSTPSSRYGGSLSTAGASTSAAGSHFQYPSTSLHPTENTQTSYSRMSYVSSSSLEEISGARPAPIHEVSDEGDAFRFGAHPRSGAGVGRMRSGSGGSADSGQTARGKPG